ncbi:MAG: nucleotidyltransferase family protein [bacterium]
MQDQPRHPGTRALLARFLRGDLPEHEAAPLLTRLVQGGRLSHFLRTRPYHRIGPAVAARARELGLGVPRSLEARAAACTLRSRLLRRQLGDVVGLLGDRGVRVCLIKGAASLVEPAPAGCLPARLRPMEDLDIVVRPEHADIARELMADRGWLCRSGSQPMPFRLDAPALVDVHAWSPHSAPLGFLELADFFESAPAGSVGGRQVAVLAPKEHVRLRLAHNVIRQHLFVDFPLIHLHELASVAHTAGGSVNWTAVRSIGLMHGVSRIFYAILLRLREEFGAPVPDGVIPPVELEPARRVRRLLDRIAGVPDRLYGAASRHALVAAAAPGQAMDHVNRAAEELVARPADEMGSRGPLAQVLRPLRTVLLHLAFRYWSLLPGRG